VLLEGRFARQEQVPVQQFHRRTASHADGLPPVSPDGSTSPKARRTAARYDCFGDGVPVEENDLPWFGFVYPESASRRIEGLTTGRNSGNVDEVTDFDARAFWFSASKSKPERAGPQESSAEAMDSAKAETRMNTGFSTFGRIVGRSNRLLAATVAACIQFA